MRMPKFMLTTIDNPFDPFTQFEDWLAFDEDQGYNTCGHLASAALTSNDLSDEDQDEAIDSAVEQVARINVLGVFKKVQASDYRSPDPNPD